ncbi:MAG TPA: hypothetical protein VLC46_23515 [Thermoanaerobaculia bacterium]|nr:hypothetical protein [Thermoanaerobaculia bacterium]
MSFLTTLRLAADCSSTVVVQVPATACKSGTATAAVAAVPGAIYAWTVDGGQIVGDATSDQIIISLGTGAKATASVTVATADGCVSSGIGLIVLHDPFTVNIAAIPPGRAGEPLTVLWAYANGTPAEQTISGDFGLVTLAPNVRSYTYTPQASGNEQVVIDAGMVLTTNLPPGNSRRRSVAKSPVNASSCATVHTAASFTVSECMQPAVVVDAPDTVVTGTTFQIDVRPQPGAVAIWTISNGSPATATGNTVMVTAGPSGKVDVNVQLTRAACTAQLDRSIAITAAPVCGNPKASVSLGPISCGSGIVNATFTGTPPFQGVWSDGSKFSVGVTAIAHAVTMPGNYTIVSFQDAICTGTSSGVAVVPALLPTATVFGGGCTSVDSATVEFTGKPPFSGCWNDNTCFQTNQMGITKLLTVAGSNTLTHGTDGTNCPLTIIGAAQASQSPSIQLSSRCTGPGYVNSVWGNYVQLYVTFNGSFVDPATVTWSDGVTNSGERAESPPQTTTYTIVGASAHRGFCDLIINEPHSVTVYPTPLPDFALPSTLCEGSTATVSLATPPPPGTTVTWSVGNATIIAGQGTNTLQYTVGGSPYGGDTAVDCKFTFSDPAHCPLTTQRGAHVIRINDGLLLRWTNGNNSANVAAGQSLPFDFWLGDGAVSYSFTNTMNDTITTRCPNPGGQCFGTYTSSHGDGQSTITLHEVGACQNHDATLALTIVQ